MFTYKHCRVMLKHLHFLSFFVEPTLMLYGSVKSYPLVGTSATWKRLTSVTFSPRSRPLMFECYPTACSNIDVWTLAFKHRQPIFERALPTNRYDYALSCYTHFWNAQILVTCHVSILTYPECCNYVLFEKVKKFIFVVEPVFDCDASLMFSVN